MSDVAEFIQCDARNYTTGRRGCGVSKIVVHYTSTDASAHDNVYSQEPVDNFRIRFSTDSA